MIRVLLVDDQPLLRGGFRVLIDSAGDLCVVGEAGTGREALAMARHTRADVVLMDIRMPDGDGLAATRDITADPDLAGVHVLILTTFEIDEYVYQALRAGASGFLGKSAEPDELLAAIRTVHRGDALLSPAATRSLIARFLGRPAGTSPAGTSPAFTAPALTAPGAGPGAGPEQPDRRLDGLTEREREVLALVGTGLSNEDIAQRLVVSPHTVKTHINRAMAKLGAHDRAQLVVTAYETGLVRPGY